ncbi:hypothetical protein T484DRAFT_1966171 [Baffinella frigidus]|nr:hypothetical protein T484DRAFT_1966171 [Cryptophyta sp. CCMP2293]
MWWRGTRKSQTPNPNHQTPNTKPQTLGQAEAQGSGRDLDRTLKSLWDDVSGKAGGQG